MYVKINVVRVEKTSKNRNHQQNQKNIINLSNNQILIRIYKNKSCYVRGKCGHHPTNCQYRRRDKSLKVQKPTRKRDNRGIQFIWDYWKICFYKSWDKSNISIFRLVDLYWLVLIEPHFHLLSLQIIKKLNCRICERIRKSLYVIYTKS